MGQAVLRIVSVGECTMDEYPDLQQEFVGGISLNFAVNCRRAGAEMVSLVSCAGKDYGERILHKLANERVDASHVKIQPGATARQKIIVQPGGERTFPPGGYQAGVLGDYHLETSDIEFIRGHDLLFAPLFKQVESLFRQTIEIPFDGWRVADLLDLADYDHDLDVVEELSKKLKIAFLSGDHELVEDLRTLSRSTDCLIVLTLGAGGSVALAHGESMCQPAVTIAKAVDSTGCGDAFQAAFTVSYCRDGDLRRALQRGAQQAARVLQRYGGTD